jgi:hypothetical protein
VNINIVAPEASKSVFGSGSKRLNQIWVGVSGGVGSCGLGGRMISGSRQALPNVELALRMSAPEPGDANTMF